MVNTAQRQRLTLARNVNGVYLDDRQVTFEYLLTEGMARVYINRVYPGHSIVGFTYAFTKGIPTM